MANETKHVKIAFETYVKDQMAAVTDIDYAGTDFNTGNYSEWIKPRWLGESAFSVTGTQSGARREAHTFSIDVFVKAGLAGETTHRVHELVDLLRNAFDWYELAVPDYSDDEATEATIQFEEADVTPVREERQGQYVLQMINVTWEGVLWA